MNFSLTISNIISRNIAILLLELFCIYYSYVFSEKETGNTSETEMRETGRISTFN